LLYDATAYYTKQSKKQHKTYLSIYKLGPCATAAKFNVMKYLNSVKLFDTMNLKAFGKIWATKADQLRLS
jgi:hypothetical protein